MPKKSPKAKPNKNSKQITIVTVLLCILVLSYIYIAKLPLATTILAIIIVLLGSGYIISTVNAFPNFLIIYAGSTKPTTKIGLSVIEYASKHNARFWRGLTEWGLVLSFGLLSYFIFKKHVSKKMLLFGLISIILIQVFVLPYITLTYGLIRNQSLQSNAITVQGYAGGYGNYVPYLLLLISVIGGFGLFIFAELIYIATLTVYGIFAFSVEHTLSTPPGPTASPVIPGVTIPLFAGIISLIIVITTHELSHGVMVRLNGLKVKSIGLLLVGIIPFGAFVEPNEKAIAKLDKKQQNMISIAGVATNFLVTIPFAALTILTATVLSNYMVSHVVVQSTITGTPAYNTIPIGSTILKWNNYNISGLQSLTSIAHRDLPFTNVTIITNNATYVLKTNSTGKVGVLLIQQSTLINGIIPKIINFLFSVFGLTFMLSFFVGAFNLLPIPGFDGWRLYRSVMKEKTLMLVTLIAIIVFIMILLPWLWFV